MSNNFTIDFILHFPKNLSISWVITLVIFIITVEIHMFWKLFFKIIIYIFRLGVYNEAVCVCIYKLNIFFVCLDLLTDKGVYPHDYFDNFNKFNEKELPPIEEFYSKLTEEHVKQEEYERAQKIYRHFNIQNSGEYHNLYLQTDVLLLTDVFENFRTKCLEDYHLDPAHYFTLPNFAWDAMLLKTGIRLDLIYDEDIYKMVENGLRGGMCQVSHRKAETNNKYMEEL